MATKAELEVELAALKAQNEALRSRAEQEPAPPVETAPQSDLHVATQLKDFLSEHGIDTTDAEAIGNQLVDELSALHKDHPLVTLLGVFALGCVVGRAFK